MAEELLSEGEIETITAEQLLEEIKNNGREIQDPEFEEGK